MTRQTFVIGTAGHVDHGKSTLVKALTGIDPDRLREEKEREMTIDLGFAWMTLPSGRRLSIVDVPGHERFIKNMLAGVGGFDAALLVVAADEGPMPQTREHLAIIDLLEIRHGVVALTKRDLVDEDWLELVHAEVEELLRGTTLEGARIIPVAATRGQGLTELIDAIDRVLDHVPPHPGRGRPRLAIDRVFTIAGFGTVVTGTLRDGELEVGQEVEILPRGLRARVRGLQSHRTRVERALPGSRTAVNLSGVEVDDIARGDVLTVPGWLKPTTLLDARLRMVPDAPAPLEQNDEVDFFVGTTETLARVTLLDAERLEPGQSGWVQLRLQEPIVAARGDRFILRRPSPSSTLGGGIIVDTAPRRHRRFRPEVIRALEALASGDPETILLQILEGDQVFEWRELLQRASLDESTAAEAIQRVIAAGHVLVLDGGDGPLSPTTSLVRREAAERLCARLLELVRDYHARFPLRRGLPREMARSRLGLTQRAFDYVVLRLARAGQLVEEDEILRLPEHRIRLDAEQESRARAYEAALRQAPFTPPAPAEYGLESELVQALADLGRVVRITDDVVFAPEAWEAIQQRVLALIDAYGSVTLAQVRDELGTSRKYAQALLEYLDQRHVTRRVGDARVRYA
ncbi:selenocysteine-specific translation elongation factor [Thermomicrobium sp. CFH 73360]|uniref:selenocysteine-specific translation elongation factor n=1 Tax=Thermomicrobium sp. CFH 73360 TaxID=2951987 RepID=UPI002076FF5D|nr:selenocysteine-specific translation elongation factor [Thermomicrobium sp. CFH 73360]MCM8747439.1 selenocysteine-specific translation elongation factor [Thermomicrobium sp. CFH 73360]